MTLLVAAILALGEGGWAARASARTAQPFPEVPVESPPPRSHAWAYASMAIGVGLIGGSFGLADRASRSYDEYLAATEPDEIERLYDRTVRYDRLASGALLVGEVLVVAGLYLRFLRRPDASRVSLGLGPQRCVLALRF